MMKSKFAAFLKSPVGKFHTSFALFIALNLLTGFVNLFIRLSPFLVTVHFYTGILIVLAPAAYMLFTKNRSMVIKALVKMVTPNKVDLQKKKAVAIAFKLSALLIFLLTVLNALSGIFYKFAIWQLSLSYRVHVFDFKVLLVLVPLHILLALALHRKPKAKAVPQPAGRK